MTFARAKELRKNMTPAEKVLWQRLRNYKVDGFYFRRQHPIKFFIADFYCAKADLIIEIDGGIHNNPDVCEHDVNRTAELPDFDNAAPESIQGSISGLRASCCGVV